MYLGSTVINTYSLVFYTQQHRIAIGIYDLLR